METDEKQAGLLAELKAIEDWDRDYHRQIAHDAFEEQAYQCRRERRKEILTRLGSQTYLKERK